MSSPQVVISLGAGVQSSTLLLMAAAGEFAVTPELAIFADTGWEPAGVYAHLKWLEEQVADSIEIVRVSAGNLRDDLLAFAQGGDKRYASPPLFIHGPVPAPCRECGGSGHASGVAGMVEAIVAGEPLADQPVCERCEGSCLDPVERSEDSDDFLRRQCTREYKIDPIARELRRRGCSRRREVEQWIGLSADETQRMKPSRISWQRSHWPLIERGMSRADCLRWFHQRYPGRPLVKSACVGCPFHSDATWRELKRSSPSEFADAVAVDAAIRSLPKLDGEAYLHRKRVPLEQVDFSSAEDLGQLQLLDAEDFAEECEGVCGV